MPSLICFKNATGTGLFSAFAVQDNIGNATGQTESDNTLNKKYPLYHTHNITFSLQEKYDLRSALSLPRGDVSIFKQEYYKPKLKNGGACAPPLYALQAEIIQPAIL